MKENILAAAVKVAARKGLNEVTRDEVALAAGCAPGSVSYYFDNMRKLRAAIVSQAIADRALVVIGRALAVAHPLAVKAPAELKKAALTALAALK
jgi:AcrR family transcriptional regulator